MVTLKLQAGDGGHGKVSFRREKYVPKGGPDGGRGGDGGHVIIRGSAALTTLNHFAGVTEVLAEPGGNGGSRKKIGGRGESVVIEVPLGTIVWEIAENPVAAYRRAHVGFESLTPRDEIHKQQYETTLDDMGIPYRAPLDLKLVIPEGLLKEDYVVSGKLFKQLQDGNHLVRLIEIAEAGQEVIICQGGLGGRGNESFKSGSLTTPLIAEYGAFAESRVVILEQRLLADVGLVGFPSAGKSTLLSVVTKARPKIAAYPFTTLEPNLGILTSSEVVEHQPGVRTGAREIVLADIPGLIEGASDGKGLGIDFLRHIENTTVLLLVLALDETTIFDESLTPEQKATVLWKQYEILRGELEKHSPALIEKAQCLSINKIDVYAEELRLAIRAVFARSGAEPILFSAITGEGLAELRSRLFAVFQEQRSFDEKNTSAVAVSKSE